MTKTVTGTECQTLQNLARWLARPDQSGVSITETPLHTAHTYLHHLPCFGEGEKDTRLATLVSDLVEVLVPAFPQQEILLKRLVNRSALNVADTGDAGFEVFKRTTQGKDITLASKMLGVDVSVVDLGKNLAFSIQSHGNNTTHELAEKALEVSSNWARRISEISLNPRVRCFENGVQDEERDCHVYPFQPRVFIPQMLQHVPATSMCEIDGKEILKSFLADSNHGVKVCELFGLPIFARLIPEHEIKGDNDTEHTWRLAQGVNHVAGVIFMRTANIHVEFLIKSSVSSAKGYERDNDPSVNYYHEQESMKKAAQALYLGLHLYKQGRNFARQN